jgi:hypothetical protein
MDINIWIVILLIVDGTLYTLGRIASTLTAGDFRIQMDVV